MSAINAIVEVRKFRRESGNITTRECCRLLRVRPGPEASFDYDAVEALDSQLGELISDTNEKSRTEHLREILRALMFHFRPPWGLLMPHGRRVLRQSATADIKQCFENAGLLGDGTDPASVTWWDELSNFFRSTAVLGRVETGRRGEILSMDHERRRLAQAGHAVLEPRWAAIDDESLGYDISSFDFAEGTTFPIFIEVKATERLPFAFYLSDNEWAVAQRLKSTYRFHFWYLPAKELRTATVDEVAAHIPLNQGDGAWKKVQVVWPFVI